MSVPKSWISKYLSDSGYGEVLSIEDHLGLDRLGIRYPMTRYALDLPLLLCGLKAHRLKRCLMHAD
jgi:hypothetical protein